MCGRFTQMMSWSQVHDLYRHKEPAAPLPLAARYNGAPTQDFAVCRLDEDGRRTAGSSGGGTAATSNRTAWPPPTVLFCHSRACGSARVARRQPAKPSPSSRRQLLPDLRTSITVSPPSSTPPYSTTGSIRRHRCRASWTWFGSPMPVPYEKRPVSAKVNSVRNNQPDILEPAVERGLF